MTMLGSNISKAPEDDIWNKGRDVRKITWRWLKARYKIVKVMCSLVGGYTSKRHFKGL